ncbi:MAG: YihY family inner membrane protein [Luminiphilus sp.]|jgi:membrane protein|nr:YihY family inner membrane protein [Luminiphilus sp.]
MVTHPYLKQAARPARYLLNRFVTDRVNASAAALTFVSLFALVPLLTVTLSIASALPDAGDIEGKLSEFLLQFLLPESSTQVVQYLAKFISQARSLTLFGIAILLATAILMLRHVERALNDIWRNRTNRKPLQGFLLYWAVLSLGPAAIGLGIGAKAYLFAVTHEWAGFPAFGVGSAVIQLLPFALSAIGLTGLYIVLPNSQVPFRHALVGGIFAAITFTVARMLFTTVMAESSYTLVYGAFAAVPLFLIWIYITWVIILVGAVLTHSLSAYQTTRQAQKPTLVKTLEILNAFWAAHQQGHSISELAIIGGKHHLLDEIDADSWRHIRDMLIRAQLLTPLDRGHFILSRDLHQVTLSEVVLILRNQPAYQPPSQPEPWQKATAALLEKHQAEESSLLSISLADLFSVKAF